MPSIMFRGLKKKVRDIFKRKSEALSTTHSENLPEETFHSFSEESLQEYDEKVVFQQKKKTEASKAASAHVLLGHCGTIRDGQPVGTKVFASLENQEYFHGILPQDVINSLTVEKGDFLVTKCNTGSEVHFVLSVLWKSPMHIQILQTPSGKFHLEGPKFKSIPELINYYFHTKEFLSRSAKVILFKPIGREERLLSSDDVVVGEKIGQGECFDVFAGTYQNPLHPSHPPLQVAIKKCNRAIPEAEDWMFISEARRVRRYIHPNIVRLIGACAQRHPVMIVMELIPGGALRDYLRKDKSHFMSVEEILAEKARFCKDAATGMDYLARQGCLHRSLAARNCLLGENKVIKIDVFGRSLEANEYRISKEKLPVKWTALEVIMRGIYTRKADVWAYGILMWEIYANGANPYPNMNHKDTAIALEQGHRMEPPIGMPKLLATVMLKCWARNQDERPEFSSIERKIQRYIQSVQSTSAD